MGSKAKLKSVYLFLFRSKPATVGPDALGLRLSWAKFPILLLSYLSIITLAIFLKYLSYPVKNHQHFHVSIFLSKFYYHYILLIITTITLIISQFRFFYCLMRLQTTIGRGFRLLVHFVRSTLTWPHFACMVNFGKSWTRTRQDQLTL